MLCMGEEKILYKNFARLFEEFHLPDVESTAEGLLTEEERDKIEAYATLILRKMQKQNKTFDQLFRQHVVSKKGDITIGQVRNVLQEQLYLPDSNDLQLMLDFLEKTGSRANMVSI